ncbi:hypothetical protein NIASO_05315 [Niabella soli DSM 19437]|uniref:Uncharacterized protein n=1 Tax=Niabella soli DSM 19437 TaxID=929713 RepID=W0F7H1_9BACT|nr:hypothetical protein NIASO_05315 [Niabella soli DSM 19437]
MQGSIEPAISDNNFNFRRNPEIVSTKIKNRSVKAVFYLFGSV